MTQVEDTSREMRIDPDSFAGGYFRNAVYRHWDPYDDIPESYMTEDVRKLTSVDMTEGEFEEFRTLLALFGAGEEAVTEDLAPLMLVLDDIDDQMFISSQIYEEAKHTQFFDRYWREVVDPFAEHYGFERTAPTDQRYFDDDYVELFDRTESAMHRLLEPGEDTPENRVRAYCHYHLVVESVLAQTGYYGIQSAFSQSGADIALREEELEAEMEDDWERLDGLVDGITRVRSDEWRHVGFGMHKVRQHIAEDEVDPGLVRETLSELLPLVLGTVQGTTGVGVDPEPIVEYAQEKLLRRIEILTDEDAELPPVEELVDIEGADDVRAT